ncbi:GAF domain-containing protein [Scytonema sp. UIC 10036]|uniref:hybrid sensor histidine kinase/response regulator n=1 Tax=Scytonema sp. UIC 10036 TaxID=2304196 RepID=UPI0012DA7E25|nr:ATP-binding protein [Scytonema sp. UIC 10036]MUH01064.1 GAF domain-containing protein [Scytonema sp. UIC 10036]
MKRDRTGKFIHSWEKEPKQAVNLSLTQTAWQILKQQARERGFSRSELVERYARSLQCDLSFNNHYSRNDKLEACHQAEETQQRSDRNIEELVAERTSQLCQANAQLQLQIVELQRTIEALQSRQQLEQQLQQNAQAQANQRQWLEAVLNLLPIPLVFIEPQTARFTFSNQAANEMAGGKIPDDRSAGVYDVEFSCTDATGELIPPNRLPAVRVARGEKIHGAELNWHTPTGVYSLLVYADTLPAMHEQPATCVMVFQNIRSRKQAEEAIAAHAQRLNLALTAAKMGDWSWDAATDIVTFSERAAEIFGIPPGPYMTWTQMRDLLHQEDRERTRLAVEEAIQEHKDYDVEYRVLHPNGSERWVAAKGRAQYSVSGDALGMLGVVQDITELKQIEQQERFLAQASQTFAAASLDLQTVLNTITRLVSEYTNDVCVLSLLSEDGQWLDPVSVYHVDSEVREFANELLKSYPRRADEGIGGRVMQTGEPLLMPVTSQQEFRAIIKPEYHRYLDRFKVYSTLLVPLKVRGQAIGVLSLTRNHPGEPHNIDDQSLFQDLADRAGLAIANAHLYQQTQQARLIAEHTADRTARLQSVTTALSEALTPSQAALVIVEQSTAVLNAGCAMVAILNDDGTDLEVIHSIGYEQNLLDAWRSIPLTSSVPLAEAVRTGTPIWEEPLEERLARYPHLRDAYTQYNFTAWISLPLMVEGRALGGMSFGFVEFCPLSDDERAFILAMAQQCAQAIARAKLYEAEQRAKAAAEAANRIRDEFLAVLSHELRTPMNPILGWTKLLRGGNLDASKVAAALLTIERNAKLQVQLIEDLLDISCILQGKLSLNSSPIDLRLIIEEALKTVQLAAQAKAIQIQSYFEPNAVNVLGDATRLQQVIWNMLSNAIKFTPNSGRVEIHLKRVGNQAQIAVSDTGKGIKPDFLPYVFDYFRQADSSITRSFGGLGLGLAIARHIIELHGGTVRADSPGEGQGATFTITLPLMSAITSMNQEVAFMQDALTLQGIQILAVDDDADNLELVTFVLEQAGACVISVSSAQEALEKLQQTQFDILLADIGMPKMDGYTLLRQVRTMPSEKGGLIPAIALTAYAGEMNQQQALAAGFQLHISKPIDPEVLIEAVIQNVPARSTMLSNERE